MASTYIYQIEFLAIIGYQLDQYHFRIAAGEEEELETRTFSSPKKATLSQFLHK
jgi:hypothetical protein